MLTRKRTTTQRKTGDRKPGTGGDVSGD
jgi:hypothetical protein